MGRLASTLHLLLRDRALALPDDAELLDEFVTAKLANPVASDWAANPPPNRMPPIPSSRRRDTMRVKPA